LDIKIVYEDEDILAINKPAGLIVHPDGRTKEPSVSEWFANKYPQSRGVGEKMGQVERPGIVHRIDRETSGLLLLAKTSEGHAHLKEQFQNREIDKFYHLFIHGVLKEDRGTINLPIGRSASNFKKWSAQRGSRGEKREAVTYFEVLKRAEDKSASFIEAKPKTGRTHQIRVHFQALHHPVLGDKLYGPKTVPRSLGGAGRIFTRLALHARAISFNNLKGEKVSLEAPYPEDFQRALKELV
jgi:23S rRNA pseudouridine1911/1915/1917 synthase